MTQDSELFWKLLEPEYVRAGMFCRKLAGDRDRGDDLFQDGLVTALAKFDGLRDQAAFRPWLYRILINTYKSRVRQKWWRKLVPLGAVDEPALAGEDPGEWYHARHLVQRGFRALTLSDRALVTLHELEGWPVAELAGLFGKSENAIAVRLFRARKKLKQALAELSGELPDPNKTKADNG